MPYVQSDFTCNLDPTSQMKLVIEGNEWTKVVCKFQCKKTCIHVYADGKFVLEMCPWVYERKLNNQTTLT